MTCVVTMNTEPCISIMVVITCPSRQIAQQWLGLLCRGKTHCPIYSYAQDATLQACRKLVMLRRLLLIEKTIPERFAAQKQIHEIMMLWWRKVTRDRSRLIYALVSCGG